MKLLAFVDLHGSMSTLRKIIRRAKKPDIDIIINAGDHTIFGEKFNQIMRELNKIKKPVLTIHGNHETEKEIASAAKRYKNIINLHKRHYKKNSYLFLGWGGGGFSLVDKDFEKTAKKFKKLLKNKKKIILVTHAPPYGTEIDKIMKEHCGNKSIRKFITKHHPILAISGHLHENAGKTDKLARTKLINPGPRGKVLQV